MKLTKMGFMILLLTLMTSLSLSNIVIAKKLNIKTTDKEWRKTYGGSSFDRACTLLQTADGGFVLAGITNSYGTGDSDIWLVKTNANGTSQWNQTYGGQENDYVSSIIQVEDGGFLLVGTTHSFGAGGSDMWLIKTDSNGSVQWNQTYGKQQYEHGSSIIQAIDGGYALAGKTYSYGAGGSDMWLIKIDSNGTIQWNQTYGETNYEETCTLLQTVDGGFILAGNTQWYATSIISNILLIKVDTNGTILWNQTFGDSSSNEFVASMIQTMDGGFALAGEIDKGFRSDMYLMKIESNGRIQWNQTYGGKNDERALAIIQTEEKQFILAGSTNTYGAGEDDIWVVKTDENGTVLGDQTYGGSKCDYVFAMIQTVDGELALAGSTNSYGAGDFDMWLIKTNPNEWVSRKTGEVEFIPLIGAFIVLTCWFPRKKS